MFRNIGIGVGIAVVLAIVFCIGSLVEPLSASDVMVIQYPGGKLQAFTQPGWYAQWFGDVTKYPKRESFEIEKQKIWFNDGGTATITGNVQFDVPLDPEGLIKMHTKFRGPEAVMSKLVAPSLIKAINASGSLMSSREAYAERRSELQHDIDDQLALGTWQIRINAVTETDPLTKEVKTLNKGAVILDAQGKPVRYEESPLKEFDIKTFGLTIADISYDEAVAKQIKQQQDITMAVQTAIANARKAEQDAITTAKQGEAKAATAKWEKEAERAAATTVAQQKFDVATIEANQRLGVATLDAKSAEQEKAAKILRGEGDAAARKLVLAADNALTQRLDAWKYGQQVWAEAFAKYNGPALVPSVVAGGGNGAGNAGLTPQDIVTAFGINQYKALALDPTMAAPTSK